ncbi:MAG: hypothetical protein MJE77_47035 [Proteobacteria bacterium]|nr:hypothetical protein [Pseudomonadota bacterium]
MTDRFRSEHESGSDASTSLSRRRRLPVLLPPRKPMLSARRVSLFEREIRIRLGQAAIEVLLANASVLSEGQVAEGYYFGSTMLTIDLARSSVHLSEACDLVTARNAEALIATDERIKERVRELAIAEAGRLAGNALESVHVESRVRRNGRYFQIDVDVEAQLRRTPGHETPGPGRTP